MERSSSEVGQQPETISFDVVDKQIDDLLGGVVEEKAGKPVPKTKPERAGNYEGKRRRVVVTGMGAVTPLGLTVDEFWQGLIEGRSGIDKTTLCDVSALSCQIAGEVKGFDPRNYMDHKDARRMARFSQFVIAAAKMAVEQAGLDTSSEDAAR
ncbi:MAG: beta-ketoacyl synthase N-terminal-like domain-containing protein, partial [Chloroflexota bacterium]|nr:beta-ketoacyl synthase N-terminal-like domain-containing protein [Chloroflexota bacterium]